MRALLENPLSYVGVQCSTTVIVGFIYGWVLRRLSTWDNPATLSASASARKIHSYHRFPARDAMPRIGALSLNLRRSKADPLTAKSLARVDTEYSADSIEFCPHPGFEDLFVCGTYQVLEPNTTAPSDGDDGEDLEVDASKRQTERTGRLLLFQVTDDQAGVCEVQRIETAAILDCKWLPYSTHAAPTAPVLAVGDAKGRINLLTLDPVTRRLVLRQALQVTDQTTLCLSLDFEPAVPPRLAVSLSSGHLALLTQDSTGDYTVTHIWAAHEYEPWITAWDRWAPHTVWSGGDDCRLKRWDLSDPTAPIQTFASRPFAAGVTTIASSPHTPYLLAVGSYDEHLRLFDTRRPARPVRTVHVGGGIWRTKFHPSDQRIGDILLACMHNGFCVVRVETSFLQALEQQVATDDSTNTEIVTHFEEHTSLAYGVDWSRQPERDEGSLVVSCSFYDHTMHMWRA